MVLARVTPGCERSLRELLETMNSAPGMADPANAVLPFGQFERLHFARLAVLDDPTLGDIEAYGIRARACRCTSRLSAAVTGPPASASRIWHGARARACAESSCTATASTRRATSYLDAGASTSTRRQLHQLGGSHGAADQGGKRAATRARRESAARAARIGRASAAARRELIDFVDAEVSAGRLGLTPPEPTPLRWQVAKLLHLVAIPLAGLILAPFLIVLSPLLIFILRTKEESDAEICPPPDRAVLLELQHLEDHDMTTSTRRSARSSRDCFAAGS